MALLTDMPAEVFRSNFSEAVGPQRLLPPHDKWTDSRLRLAQQQELYRCYPCQAWSVAAKLKMPQVGVNLALLPVALIQTWLRELNKMFRGPESPFKMTAHSLSSQTKGFQTDLQSHTTARPI